MIEGLYSALHHYPGTAQTAAPHKVLRMVKNDRMGGMIPKWETTQANMQNTPAANTAAFVEHTLEQAINKQSPQGPENALAFRPQDQNPVTDELETAFGFGDLLDMVNPLHHIPIVGHLYREFTGDTIKPMSQIMGGALFGGPIGVAGSLINTVVQAETGEDMTGNALAMMGGNALPWRSFENRPALSEDPETRLSNIEIPNQPAAPLEDLPGALLAFVDLQDNTPKTGIKIERSI